LSWLEAIVLGLVQGLTEFLPVSSTGHLILVSDLLKLDPERFGLSFDVALHLGTALAVLLYFARTWIDLLMGLFRGQWRMPALIVLGTAPAAIAGVLFQSAIEREMRGPSALAPRRRASRARRAGGDVQTPPLAATRRFGA